MSPLVRMRLAAFVRGGRAFVPLLTTVVVLAVWYGGGAAPVTEAYGSTGVVLFPVLAWQTKLLLDAEPDVQRRLARSAVGPRCELGAGLLAAAVAALVLVAVTLLVPWAVGGVRLPVQDDPPLAAAIPLGVWGLLLGVPAAVGLGALASRAITRTVAAGAAVLVSGAVLAIALGLRDSIAPWLVPPIMAVARALTSSPGASGLLLPTAHALGWSAVALAGYAVLRRHRA
jgi:hypothetical protein